MTYIALLCPTRNRPEQFKRMCESAQDTAYNAPPIYSYISHDDDAAGYSLSSPHAYRGPDYPTVYKWNFLADKAMRYEGNKLFMLAADDMIFTTKNWDRAIIDHYEALNEKVHVYSLRDSRDAAGTPHPIITREWIEFFGWAFPPIFMHWQLDTWTVAIAKSNNVFSHLKDYLLMHCKPSDQGTPDETHLGIRRAGYHQRDKYVAEKCAYYLEYEKKRLDDYLRSKELFKD